MSFPSTLYLYSILDLLLKDVPISLQSDLRLGLQEALVNAARHGNSLDPQKSILVKYRRAPGLHEWVIQDQGLGFDPPVICHLAEADAHLPAENCECGRGLHILFQIFDQVQWLQNGTTLHLTKRSPL